MRTHIYMHVYMPLCIHKCQHKASHDNTWYLNKRLVFLTLNLKWRSKVFLTLNTDLEWRSTLETSPWRALRSQHQTEQQRRGPAWGDSAGTHPLPDSLPTKWRLEERRRYCPAVGRNNSSFLCYTKLLHIFVHAWRIYIHTLYINTYILLYDYVYNENLHTYIRIHRYIHLVLYVRSNKLHTPLNTLIR